MMDPVNPAGNQRGCRPTERPLTPTAPASYRSQRTRCPPSRGFGGPFQPIDECDDRLAGRPVLARTDRLHHGCSFGRNASSRTTLVSGLKLPLIFRSVPWSFFSLRIAKQLTGRARQLRAHTAAMIGTAFPHLIPANLT